MSIKTLGIDIAKNVFQLHGVDQAGNVVLRKRLSRSKLLEFITTLQPCLVGMEACSGSNYWYREISKLGHTVKLMSPQYVKPYVKTNKNDFNDAEAICEAVTRPHMHFVSPKTTAHQDVQMIHRVRTKILRDRTSLANQIRGLLMEYGITLPQGMNNLRKGIPLILDNPKTELSSLAKEIFFDLYEQLINLDKKMKEYDQKIIKSCQMMPECQRLMQVEGIGPLSASAFVSSIGDPRAFKSGRQCASWLGLVPRQHSSGNKITLLGISKRGDRYLRSLLIHGGRSVVKLCSKRDDPRSLWLAGVKERRGFNKACVALANKNARILWSLMTHKQDYRTAQ